MVFSLIGVAFLASSAIWIKHSALPPVTTGFYRAALSVPMLYPLARGRLGGLSKKDVLILMLAGVFLAGDTALWNLSFSFTSVANANLLGNLTPLTIVPVSYFLFREKIPRFFFTGAFITLAGVFILLGGKASPAPSGYLGDFIAFSASFFYAGFILISYHMRDRVESSAIMLVSGIGCALTLLPASILIEGVRLPKALSDLLPLIALAVTVQLIGHNVLSHCQGKLQVNLLSVICLTQPVIAAAYALFIFNETISYIEMLGIITVICGVYITKRQYGTAS